MCCKLIGWWRALLAATGLFLGIVPAAHTATIVLYDFQEPDPTGSFTNAPDTTAGNISAGAWSLRDGLLIPLPLNLTSPDNWAVSGLSWGDGTDLTPAGNRYRFTITVAPGFSLNLNSVSFDDQRFELLGVAGPTSWSLSINGASVLSGQATDPTNNGLGWTSRTVGFAPVTGLTGSFFVDLFAFGATPVFGNAQVWNVDNFQLEGVVVPLPPALWLLGASLVALMGISRKRSEG